MILLSDVVLSKNILLTSKNTVILSSSFNSASTSRVVTEMTNLVNNPINSLFNVPQTPKRDFYLVLISPCGGLNSGLIMLDALNSLGVNIHVIVFEAASMGFITTQYLGNRYILRHGTLMSHKMRGGMPALEFPGQMDSRYNYWKRRSEIINEQVVKRTEGKQTMKSYDELIENEYWCQGQDCVDAGFADEIVGVVCDISLQVKKIQESSYSFFGSSVKVKSSVSACPLTSGKHIMQVKVDGQIYDYSDTRLNNFINSVTKEKK